MPVAAMKLVGQTEDQIDVRLRVDELVLLRNALKEFCEGMHFTENDFQVILDTRRADAEDLLMRIGVVLDRTNLLRE